jgi:hypothetical protein
MPITVLEVLPWQTLSARFLVLCSPLTSPSKAKFATQTQTRLRSSLSYVRTLSPSANPAQPQVKLKPHQKARKAQANQNPAKPNKNASL